MNVSIVTTPYVLPIIVGWVVSIPSDGVPIVKVASFEIACCTSPTIVPPVIVRLPPLIFCIVPLFSVFPWYFPSAEDDI